MKSANTLALDFSDVFPGTVWRMVADLYSPRLYLEVRDPQERRVTFSALNLQNNLWMWKEVAFDESWWISLAAAAGNILLLTVYTDTQNPDKKSLIAYHVVEKEILWWYNGFSLETANSRFAKGLDAKFPGKEIILDLFTGKPVQQADFDLEESQNFPVIRPFQYEEGTDHFNTVRHFLETRLQHVPVTTVEYVEYSGIIFLSAFVKQNGLANYLYAFDTGGELIFKETLAEDLKGVGLDTFFIYSGRVIFVKNKNELRSYKIL